MQERELVKLSGQALDGWRVRELLEAMGLKHTDVQLVEIYPQSVRAEVLVTDAHGRRVIETEMRTNADTREVVNVVVGTRIRVLEMGIRNVWEKPVDADPDPGDRSLEDREQMMADIEKEACGAWKNLGSRRMVCELKPGHEGDHDYSRDTGRILGDRPQA